MVVSAAAKFDLAKLTRKAIKPSQHAQRYVGFG